MSRLSTYDLVLEVALAAENGYYGTTGQEAEMIPIDPVDLARCLRVVNNGIRDFIARAPVEGWRWRDRLMEVDLVRSYTGTASAANATSITDGDIAGDYADDYFNGYVLRITAGTGIDEYATVADYTGATGVFTFAALSGGTTPDTTSEYRICRSTQVIDSDPARYLLTQDFQGEYTGAITFAAGSEACGIEWSSEAQLRKAREMQVNGNDAPFLAALLPSATKRRWELIVDPEPTNEHTVVFPYKASFDALTLVAGTANAGGATSLTDADIAGLYPEDHFNGKNIRILSGTGKTSYAVCTDYTGATGVFTVADWLYQSGAAGGTDPASGSVYVVDAGEVHPAGMQFDFAIRAACLAAAEEEFTDVKRGFTEKYLQNDLPMAHAIDGRSAPKKLGVMRGQSQAGTTAVIERGIITYEVK
ncbi:MAG: hypothetical protein ABFD89_12490 [Bryobacteraceae bacterium]